MAYVGIDHSTTAVRSNILYEDGTQEGFSVRRTPDQDLDFSYKDRLFEYVDRENIKQIAYGYSYGDAVSAVRDIDQIENRGVVDTYGLGHEIGLGTVIYDELRDSSLPCVVFPGIHENLETLHPYFRHYRLLTGADKFATARFAREIAAKNESGGETSVDSIISANISSSSMAVYQSKQGIKGAFFWLALIHGWGDVKTFRQGRDNPDTLREAYLNSGILERNDMEFESLSEPPTEEISNLLYWSCIHNIYSLLPFANEHNNGPDLIVLSGRFARSDHPSNIGQRCKETLRTIAPVHIADKNATAIGASLIGRDVATGTSEIMGVPVRTN